MIFLNKNRGVLMGFFNSNDTTSNISNENNSNVNLEVNKKNSEEFEKLMDNASTNLDSYWDKNNPILKIFLLILLVIIVLGAIYYITAWNASK